jgi:endo-1,4-beta-xylanase
MEDLGTKVSRREAHIMRKADRHLPIAASLLIVSIALITMHAQGTAAQENDYQIVPRQRVGRWELRKPLSIYGLGQPSWRWESRTPTGVAYSDNYVFHLQRANIEWEFRACKSDGTVVAVFVRVLASDPPADEALKFRTREGIGIGVSESQVVRLLGNPDSRWEWKENHELIARAWGLPDVVHEVSIISLNYAGLHVRINQADRRVIGIGVSDSNADRSCQQAVLGGSRAVQRPTDRPLPSCPVAPPPPPGVSLRSLAQARGILIGAAVNEPVLIRDEAYRQVLAREFNMVAPERSMKLGALRRERGRYDFTRADALVSFAQGNAMQVQGHVLVWYQALPPWAVQANFAPDELVSLLKEHIAITVGRYRGRVRYWDVVNEALRANGTLRNDIWRRGIGPEYAELAFRWANEADPKAQLFYNEYGGEGLGVKSDGVYEFVQGLRQRGVPIHGVGLQMHVRVDDYPKPEDVAANMRRLAALGVEVHISEMDVRIPMPVTEEKLNAQACIYRAMLNVCLSAPNCKSFVLWGFTDKYSWIPEFFPGYGAGLIFDESYRPKPAYDALVDVLMRR